MSSRLQKFLKFEEKVQSKIDGRLIKQLFSAFLSLDANKAQMKCREADGRIKKGRGITPRPQQKIRDLLLRWNCQSLNHNIEPE